MEVHTSGRTGPVLARPLSAIKYQYQSLTHALFTCAKEIVLTVHLHAESCFLTVQLKIFSRCARNRQPLSGLHSRSQTTFELLPPPLVHVAQNEQQTQNFNSCCNIVSVYTCTLASSPGPTQILSRRPNFLHGCEIKSGWGLGTRLHVHVPVHGVCVLVTCFNTCYG